MTRGEFLRSFLYNTDGSALLKVWKMHQMRSSCICVYFVHTKRQGDVREVQNMGGGVLTLTA